MGRYIDFDYVLLPNALLLDDSHAGRRLTNWWILDLYTGN